MQIAIQNLSARNDLPDDVIAFAALALSTQIEEVCHAYGIPFVPVNFYSRGTVFPHGTTHAFLIVDDLDVPGALGFHDVDANGVAYIRVLSQLPGDIEPTMSHECVELAVNPQCDGWAPWRGEYQQAREGSDRCEADTYLESVEIFGETRAVPLSNYLLPSAFVRDSVGPWDRMGRLKSWDEVRPGGYCIVRDARGRISNQFYEPGAMPATFARKLSNPSSRTMRRLRGS